MPTARANRIAAHHTRLIDNPLFEHTFKRPAHGGPTTAKAAKPKTAADARLTPDALFGSRIKPVVSAGKPVRARAKAKAGSAHKAKKPASSTPPQTSAFLALQRKKAASAPAQPSRNSAKYIMSTDEEKVSVFEIISDLEKQLDAAFSLKDSQEKEIQYLRDKLAKIEEKAGTAEAKLGEMKGVLVSQEQLSSELEFLENERLETVEKIKSMEKELEARGAIVKELENRITVFTDEVEVRNKRIEQIELELTSANKTMQGLHRQIELLESEKGDTGERLETAQTELANLTAERNRYKKELERAKESLDEIRLTLADTRARAREHYYKPKHK